MTSTMVSGPFDAAYSLYSPETDILSLSSATTPQRPVSTHTFGSGGKEHAHVAMNRQFSDSSYQSLPQSPLGYRGAEAVKLSPNNIVVLDEEIDPLDKTPQEETIRRLAKAREQRNGPASSTNSTDAAMDDLFPEGSQTSSHTSVQEEEEILRQKVMPVSPSPNRRATTGIVELGPVIDTHVQRSTSLSAASSPRLGQRVLRKQVPEWTESLENLEQLRITPTTTPQFNRSGFSASTLLVSATSPMTSELDTLTLPSAPREDGILARTARRLRLGSKEKERDRVGPVGEMPTDISGPITIGQAEPRERRKTMPHIPTRTVSLAAPAWPPRVTDELDSRTHHPYNHFIYAQDYAAPYPDPSPLEEPTAQAANELINDSRRPSEQTFTSGFSLTRLTDEDNIPSERDTPGKRLAPLPEPLSGYEGGDRFSAQPLAGMSKSFSENHLVLGGPARTTIALNRGVSFQQRAVRTTKLFTLSESGSASVPAHSRTASRSRITPRGSPMLDHDAPTFPSAPSPIPRSTSRHRGLFSRNNSSFHVSAPTGHTSSDTEPSSDAPTRPFSLAARRARARAREREAEIFAAGPDRLPTTREMLDVGRHRVYDVAGRKVAFRDIIAGGVGWQTVVVFIRHWYCPLCAEYVESIVRSVTPEALESAKVKLIIIGNGSRRMLPAYSTKVMRCPFEMYTDPKLRVYRGLGMTRQTHDGGEEDEKGDYVTMGTMKGTLAVAKRAIKMPLGRPGTIPQLGGEFIFSSSLSCTYAHRMINTRSHAPIRDVIALTGARLDFIHTERGPPAPLIHRTPMLGVQVEQSDGMLFGNWGESGVRLSVEERRALEARRESEGEEWRVAKENELERIREQRERRRSRLEGLGRAACEAEDGEGLTSADEAVGTRIVGHPQKTYQSPPM